MKKGIHFLLLYALLNSCMNALDKDLGNGYLLEISDGYSKTILNSENTILIDSEILEYAFDSVFIIASHRPWDSIPGVIGLKSMSYNERNEAFDRSNYRQYWIINKKIKNIYEGFDERRKRAKYSNVFGPYTRQEYMKKKIELGVPFDLNLVIEGDVKK